MKTCGGVTLAAGFNPKHNSLNSLRLLFAVGVIFSHSWPVGGFGHAPSLGDFDAGSFSVSAFFVASGYLIAGSRERNSLVRYSWLRFLRIYPAFWVCLLVTSFVFSPIAGMVRGGWGFQQALGYIVSNFTLHIGQWTIGDTLKAAPENAWNGSLWTLFFEFGCYVLLGLFLSVDRFRRGHWMLLAFSVSTAATIVRQLHEPNLVSGQLSRWALLIPFFLAGSLMYRYRDSIRLSAPLFALSVIAVLVTTLAHWGSALSPLPLAYAVLWLAARTPRIVERLGDGSVDISYGTYIYAYPLQQLAVLAGVNRINVVAMITVSVVATLVLATASWFLVEKPFLKLKNRRIPFEGKPTVKGAPH